MMDSFRRSAYERHEITPEEEQRQEDENLAQKLDDALCLIADLSDNLRDEGCDYSPDGLAAMRKRVVDILPGWLCAGWLKSPAAVKPVNPVELANALEAIVRISVAALGRS